ncbi:MAG: GntR family transcriptional regulator [Cryobacterium sp.]|nr:GntR family transcriptional regulator [Cryobacterium sp.]MBX3089626.1 GntR family transcriptional regulator [Cryobacterium sp.]MBX3115862.1 GntR family transcriptional regulator [Cryobacterium sp.]
MTDFPPTSNSANLRRAGDLETSKVVARVFDRILEEIHLGKLEPGERIVDHVLAQEFGVSRTPVREALQRLRELGVVEASASRYTRVAVVTPKETADALVVWTALYDALIDEAHSRISRESRELMVQDHEKFLEAVSRSDMQSVAIANLSFFARPMVAVENSLLIKALSSVVHRIQLGSLHLPDYIDFDELGRAQKMFLESLERNDPALANEAIQIIRNIRIPQES